MDFDIRLPIGLLFTLLGLILSLYGVLSDPAIYRVRSLGVNVNLGWGVVMLAFGLVMLALTRRARAATNAQPR